MTHRLPIKEKNEFFWEVTCEGGGCHLLRMNHTSSEFPTSSGSKDRGFAITKRERRKRGIEGREGREGRDSPMMDRLPTAQISNDSIRQA
jgi:hypothetical protein